MKRRSFITGTAASLAAALVPISVNLAGFPRDKKADNSGLTYEKLMKTKAILDAHQPAPQVYQVRVYQSWIDAYLKEHGAFPEGVEIIELEPFTDS